MVQWVPDSSLPSTPGLLRRTAELVAPYRQESQRQIVSGGLARLLAAGGLRQILLARTKTEESVRHPVQSREGRKGSSAADGKCLMLNVTMASARICTAAAMTCRSLGSLVMRGIKCSYPVTGAPGNAVRSAATSRAAFARRSASSSRGGVLGDSARSRRESVRSNAPDKVPPVQHGAAYHEDRGE